MNANLGESGPSGLSLQPQAIVCPKCQHKRTAADQGPQWQCPACGVAYNKATAQAAPVAPKANSASDARSRREPDPDVLEALTPRPIGFSLTGRIGRLRYLAYSWPTLVLSAFLMLLAVFTNPRHEALTMLLVIVAGVMWLWIPVRLMALRMHDINRSAKWVLALLLLPGLPGALGKPQLVIICASLFWIVAFVLMLWPGSESDNDYGPPPAANTTLITVGAVVFLILMVMGVAGNIRMISSGKLHSVIARDQAAAQQPQGSNTDTRRR